MACDHWLARMRRPCRFKVAIRATFEQPGRRPYVREYCARHRHDAADATSVVRVDGGPEQYRKPRKGARK